MLLGLGINMVTERAANQAVLSKIRGDAPAHEIWSSLCARFERTNGILGLQARNRLSECKHVDGRDVQAHLDLMLRLWEKALSVGVSIPDDEFCHLLRASFPPSWALFVATLIAENDPGALEASLLAFADLRGSSSKPVSPTSSTALISTVVKCTNCGRTNHSFEKCFRKGGGSEHSAPHWWKARQQGGGSSQGTPNARVATVEATPSGTYSSLDPAQNIAAFTASHSPSPSNPFRRQTNPFHRSDADPGSYATSDYHLFVASVGSGSHTGRPIATYADSGASHHYFVDRSDFDTYAEIAPVTGQGVGRDSTFQIVGVGSVQKDVVVDGKRRRVTFTNAVHAPDLAANLVSISRLDADGVFVQVGNGVMVFTDGSGSPFMRGTSTSGNLYELDLLSCAGLDAPRVALLSTSGAVDMATWHRRLGHIGDSGLQRLVSKHLVDGLDVKGPLICSSLCVDCIYGKHARRPFARWIEPETAPLERVYTLGARGHLPSGYIVSSL